MILFDKNNKNDVSEAQNEAGTASLGTIAKSSPSFRKIRAERYELLGKIRAIYLSAGTAEGLDIPTKYHRTSLCKHACTGSAGVELNLLKNAGRAFYKGLQTCGSVWTCPVCANKIQEIRRLEIAHTMETFAKMGKQSVMITLTFPHKRNQALKTLLDRFDQALKLFRKSGAFTNWLKKIGYEGLIRSLELTHGKNGWHPHTHELWFMDVDVDQEKIKEYLKSKWFEACKQAGLISADKENSFLKHAIDIKFNCLTSAYLAKFDDVTNWGIDREMARASTKQGKEKGKHPFRLADENNDKLFIEYTKAIKGKAQVYFGPGVKKKVGLDEISDEKAAKLEGDDELLIIGKLSKMYWSKVLNKELRSKVLDLAEDKNDIISIRSFILCSETKQNE